MRRAEMRSKVDREFVPCNERACVHYGKYKVSSRFVHLMAIGINGIVDVAPWGPNPHCRVCVHFKFQNMFYGKE